MLVICPGSKYFKVFTCCLVFALLEVGCSFCIINNMDKTKTMQSNRWLVFCYISQLHLLWGDFYRGTKKTKKRSIIPSISPSQPTKFKRLINSRNHQLIPLVQSFASKPSGPEQQILPYKLTKLVHNTVNVMVVGLLLKKYTETYIF